MGTGERVPKLWYEQAKVYMCDGRGTRVWSINIQNGTTAAMMDLEEEEEVEVEINVASNLLITCTTSLDQIKMYNLTSGEQMWTGAHPNTDMDSLLHKCFFHGEFFFTVSWDRLYIWDVHDSELSLVLAAEYTPLMADMSLSYNYIAIASLSQDTKLSRLFLWTTVLV